VKVWSRRRGSPIRIIITEKSPERPPEECSADEKSGKGEKKGAINSPTRSVAWYAGLRRRRREERTSFGGRNLTERCCGGQQSAEKKGEGSIEGNYNQCDEDHKRKGFASEKMANGIEKGGARAHSDDKERSMLEKKSYSLASVREGSSYLPKRNDLIEKMRLRKKLPS